MKKPYSESCDENRDPTLSIIQPLLVESTNILEVGSDTGQHAIYFAEKMSHIVWQTSDCIEYIPGIQLDKLAVHRRANIAIAITASPGAECSVTPSRDRLCRVALG